MKRLLRSQHTVPGWQIDSWEAPSGGVCSHDTSLIIPLAGGGLRVAVIDGATPSGPGGEPIGQDGAVWASEVVRASLRDSDPALACLKRANHYLASTTAPRTNASVICADITQTDVEIVVAGDCRVWVMIDGHWQGWGGEALQSQALAQWEEWVEANSEASAAERVRYETEEVWSKPSCWATAPVGRFSRLKANVVRIDDRPDEVVLASDGARLEPGRVENMEKWLEQLRDWEIRYADRRASMKVFDDVTVLQVRVDSEF